MIEKNLKSYKKKMKKYYFNFEVFKYRDSCKDVILLFWVVLNMFIFVNYFVCEWREMCNIFLIKIV